MSWDHKRPDGQRYFYRSRRVDVESATPAPATGVVEGRTQGGADATQQGLQHGQRQTAFSGNTSITWLGDDKAFVLHIHKCIRLC